MTDQVTSPRPILDKTTAAPAQSMGHLESPVTAWKARPFPRVVELLLRPPVILLVLVTIVVTRGITQGEFFFYNDEMRHAMNGVFFRDFLVDLPLHHPVQYAYEYYAKYPALAIPHWPPLFHFIEGVFFLIFGLSPWVSRLAILCFALMGTYFWYRITERLGPRHRAFISALALSCIPFVLIYERVTMLEIPALATCIGAVYYWLKFLETERRLQLWILAAFVTSAFLISQKAALLVFLIPLDMIVEKRFHLLKRVDVWLSVLVSASLVLPWYLLASRTLSNWGGRLIGNRFEYMTLSINYTFYLKHQYRQLGAVLIVLAGLGLLVALVKRTRVNRFMLTWVFAGYTCFLLINEKDARHAMMWVPPLVYLAVVALETLLVHRTLALIGSSAFALVLFVNAFRLVKPVVSGARDVAQYVVSLPESDIIYCQMELDGDFIFFVRKFDPERRHMIAREKQVVVGALGHDPQGILHTKEEILNLFQTWGIRYAVVDNRDPWSAFAMVRGLLNSDQFELVRTFPVYTNSQLLPVHEIQVFRYRGELHRTDKPVSIPMMTIRHNVPADLSRLAGRPWPN